MELKIEHLAPYLPYGLTFLMESEPNSKEPNTDELKSIDVGLKMVNLLKSYIMNFQVKVKMIALVFGMANITEIMTNEIIFIIQVIQVGNILYVMDTVNLATK